MLINTALESDLGIAAATSAGPSGTSIAVCSTTSEARRGVSTGAAAGIGVGVGLPLAIAVMALAVLLLREKKSRAAGLDGMTTAGGSESSPAPVWAKHEYPGGFVQANRPGYGQQPTTELPPDPTVRHELPQ